MKKFIVEREVPGASNLTDEDLKAIARTSNAALKEMGVAYHWAQTYVAGDKLYCIHVAEDADTIREHARRGGFPANLVSEVTFIMDPTTAG